MRKNSYKNFPLTSLAFYFILKSVWSLTLGQKFKVIYATSAVLFYIFHKNSDPYQHFFGKVQVNMVKPQELNMVFGESNEINGEKIVLSLTSEKKIVCF